MWAPRHPCHGWKPGKLVILQWDGTNIVPNCCRFRRKIINYYWFVCFKWAVTTKVGLDYLLSYFKVICFILVVFLLQTHCSVFQIIQIIGETDWAVYSVQLTECGSFAGHMTSVVCSEKCYTSLISRWYWTGILLCVPKTISISQHLLSTQNLDTKIIC